LAITERASNSRDRRDDPLPAGLEHALRKGSRTTARRGGGRGTSQDPSMKPQRALLSVLLCLTALVGWSQRASAGTTLSSVSNSCWTTEQPFTLVESEIAKLTWDANGNLTLVNHLGGGTVTTWGLDSPTPLTGANAGKLCFGNGAGRLRIHDSTGAMVWKSGDYSASNGVLSIDQCKVQIKNTSGAVVWEETTPQCDRRVYHKPAVTKCWSTGDTQKLLSDEDKHLELWWKSGNLTLYREGSQIAAPWISFGGTTKELCYQSDGNLVVFNTSGQVLWSAGSAVPPAGSGFTPAHLSMDECGLAFTYTDSNTQYKRRDKAQCERTSIEPGWCRDTGAAGTILKNDSVRLEWMSDGRLRLYDADDNFLWVANPAPGDRLCFQDDGDLVISGHGFPEVKWSTGAAAPHQTLTLDKCTVANLDTTIGAICSEATFEGIKHCVFFNHCTAQERKDWQTFIDWCAFDDYVSWSYTPSSCMSALPGGGFSYVKDLRKGNSDFGVELWVIGAAVNSAGLATLQDNVSESDGAAAVNEALPQSPPSGYFQILGDAGVSATLFGEHRNILEGIGYVENLNGPKDSIRFLVGGTEVYEASVGEGVLNPSQSQEFFSRDQQFFVGGVPLTVHVGVTGRLGVQMNVDYDGGTSNLTATVAPYASLDADASVGIGVSGFSVGVEGELTLVRLSVPVAEKINIGSGAFETSAELKVDTLEGSLSLYAEAWPFKASKEIASFDGFGTSTTLYKKSGSL
jgi:YD repeat-containing protein